MTAAEMRPNKDCKNNINLQNVLGKTSLRKIKSVAFFDSVRLDERNYMSTWALSLGVAVETPGKIEIIHEQFY